MILLSDHIETWTEATIRLQQGSSVLIYAPRYYGLDRFAEEVIEQVPEAKWVRLRMKDSIIGGKIDYVRLWRETCDQAKCTSKQRVRTRGEFEVALRRLIEGSDNQWGFILAGGGVDTCSHRFDLVALLDTIRHSLPADLERRFRYLVLDDLSLYYYESGRTEHSSHWKVVRLYQRPLDLHALESLFSRAEWIKVLQRDPAFVAKSVYELTGGHVGLVVELLEHLMVDKSEGSENDIWKFQVRRILERSYVLEGMRRSLAQDPRGLTEVALSYANGRTPQDFGSPNVQFLLQMGIIQRISLTRAELCPGLIFELVSDAKNSALEVRPFGTLVSELGPRLYDDRSEKLVAEDHDLVVLHISDIHLGPNFPFRLPLTISGRQEVAKRSLSQMIAKDLAELDLSSRINAIVVSGDFTQKAELGEFQRAREVLKELLSELSLTENQMVITAGNHDMQWKPGELNQTERLSGVSREAFGIFRELTGRPPLSLSDLHTIVSPTGATALQILTLDSNCVEGPKAAGIGFVCEDAFNEAEDHLRHFDASPFESVHRWIVLHHHVFPASPITVEDIERPKLTVLANSSDVLAFASRIGAEAILHGHEHQPSVTVARRWPSDVGVDFRPLIAIGAGSAGCARVELGPFARHQYYVIFRKRDRIVIRSRSMGDTGLAFGTHNDLVIPV